MWNKVKLCLSMTIMLCSVACLSTAELEQFRKDEIAREQSYLKDKELIQLCLAYDKAMVNPDYYEERLIAISRELESRKLDPLLCRVKPQS